MNPKFRGGATSASRHRASVRQRSGALVGRVQLHIHVRREGDRPIPRRPAAPPQGVGVGCRRAVTCGVPHERRARPPGRLGPLRRGSGGGARRRRASTHASPTDAGAFVFNVLFLFELIINFYGGFWWQNWFRSGWNIFDTCAPRRPKRGPAAAPLPLSPSRGPVAWRRPV